MSMTLGSFKRVTLALGVIAASLLGDASSPPRADAQGTVREVWVITAPTGEFTIELEFQRYGMRFAFPINGQCNCVGARTDTFRCYTGATDVTFGSPLEHNGGVTSITGVYAHR